MSRTYRVSNIPAAFNKEDIFKALTTTCIQPGLQNSCTLTLHPSSSGNRQTGLLFIPIDLPGFTLGQNIDIYSASIRTGPENRPTRLRVDDNFFGLTSLNDPGDKIIADVVAVTGLGGHAWGSWRSPDGEVMWLADYLPLDIKNCRIMTFGYNSHLFGSDADSQDMDDYRRALLEQVAEAREGAEVGILSCEV